jgi:hypothetical protein
MASKLLEVDDEPLSVLLKRIVIKKNDRETEKSAKHRKNSNWKPIAKLEEYYRLSLQGLKREEKSDFVELGLRNQVIQLSPILETVCSGQWLTSDYDSPDSLLIESGIPKGYEKYPKYFSCEASGGWLTVVGQNGIVIVDKAIFVSREPVFILRRNGILVALQQGMQCVEFGAGGHLVLYAYGAVVVIPGKGWITESPLIYTCIRHNFYDNRAREAKFGPLVLRPILCVYPGHKQEFFIVQVRQKLFVVKSESWDILIRENFWQLEFQTLMRLYRVLSIRGIDYRNDAVSNQTFLFPDDIVIPDQSLKELGEIVKDLTLIQMGSNWFTTYYEIFPIYGHLLLVGNCGKLPSSIVVREGKDSKLSYQRKGITHAFVMTTKALNDSSQHIRMLSPGKILLDTTGSVCHICFVFTNGMIFMVGADQYH